MDTTEAGQRIARARRRRGLSQAALAGLVGRSESWLSQVERGKRTVDSHVVLTRLAAVLRVDIAELTGRTDNDVPRDHDIAARIEHAMIGYDAIDVAIMRDDARNPPDLNYLRATAQTAYRDYQATRYEQAANRLVRLIGDVEAAARQAGPSDRGVSEVRALVYDTTAALLSRVGAHPLAWAAADRAMAAAENSGEPLLAAAGAYRLSYVLTGRQHPREALHLALTAARAIERGMRSASPEQLSIYGSLQLAAATAAAANYDQAATPRSPPRGGPCGRTTGPQREPDGNRLRTGQRRDSHHVDSPAAR